MSVFRDMKRFKLIALAALTACSGPQEPITQDPATEAAAIELDAANATEEPTNPALGQYTSYCFKRVGQIRAEPKRGEACDVHGGGAGEGDLGAGIPVRNTATLHISSPSLKASGVKSFGFVLNRGDAPPKFTSGVYVMDQVQLAGRKPSPSFLLPDRMAFVSDVTGKETLFSWSSPDAAYLKAKAPGFDFPGFEISSAVLNIESAVDLPMDSFETDYARRAGMITGKQYIEGTLKIILIAMGSKGEIYGPTTFEFGVPIDWGYSK